ncbi:Sec-independent protein translocase subunit TatB [Streptomyces mobaraensis NBRC 13819 = DSM 40847]|uniref:Sec-independent protein translocase protein TatB n=2 Tax=Streptomyces mobaraensis TaxID=35621 RepID=A0A5N5WDZ4_STRMB|nr:sec-independent translocase [Streptomyces mobaraensis]EME96460.1 sec-independent translocase [Streptomyces mobaraensis NBRC 13819 = DSM 40847]KAB7851003.1 Sec-independent protein translocase subunit TatB [Streptomyces mobaraensis]QTT75556.1 Sec-independent protein translocase subunit TatB [Streptomyces mobaraensis NBRC 13819 = DSM 40847]
MLDIGLPELIALVVLALLIFGPDKLPKMIQDVSRTLRKLRQFSESAKEDIRSELGPEFKDFEFEDLNPRTFVRKHVLDKDELGLKEIRNGFDFRSEMSELSGVTDPEPAAPHSSGGPDLVKKPDLLKKGPIQPGERPPFDSDAT